jgi:membrane-associated phospholipid phosphatase
MPTPRDFHKTDHTGRVKAARLFSNIVSPPVMFAVVGLAFSLTEDPNLEGLAWAVFYGLLVSLAPILVVLYLLRTGRIKELHMTDRGERHIPYVTAASSALLAFAIITLLNGPELLRCLALLNAINLTALGLINTRYLISIHATGIMATFLLTGIVFSWTLAWLLVFPLLLAVCYVRLYLKRHTLAQVIAGLLLGAATVWFVQVAFGCFTG